jgi:nitroimidazol reductase NimA-like FMN-containing flavoprotein (pyridoxamine 5'-phosphate oxidase superfamily)
MRRKDREIADVNKKLDILERCQVCRLGLSDNGAPYIVPLNYGYSYDGGKLTLYFHSAPEGKKIDIIKNDSRACFEVDCDHKLIRGKTSGSYSFEYSSVIGFGHIVFMNTREEKIRALDILMKHYTGMENNSFEDADLAKVNAYALVVDDFYGKKNPNI